MAAEIGVQVSAGNVTRRQHIVIPHATCLPNGTFNIFRHRTWIRHIVAFIIRRTTKRHANLAVMRGDEIHEQIEFVHRECGQFLNQRIIGFRVQNRGRQIDTSLDDLGVSVQARLAGFSAAVPGPAGWPEG